MLCQRLWTNDGQGSRVGDAGESTRLPLMWPGFDHDLDSVHTWVEFVVGSRPCSERFFSSIFKVSLISALHLKKVVHLLRHLQVLQNPHTRDPLGHSTDCFVEHGKPNAL